MTRFFPLILLAACFDNSDDELSLETSSYELVTDRNAAIAAGAAHSCAIRPDTTIQCWGRNQYGQLGNGSTANSSLPVTVVGITGAVMVTAGDYHTCAVLDNTSVRCWGNNASGQLGIASTSAQPIPVPVPGLVDVDSISGGGSHTCASFSNKTARCWGANTYGQLGNGNTTSSPTPTAVRASSASKLVLGGIVEIEAGKSSTCARLESGGVRCWGRNHYGQLGDGTTTQRLYPTAVLNVTSAMDLALGDYHACAALGNGRARCWGFNLNGQLGDGTQVGRPTPVEVRRQITPTLTYPIVNVSAIAAGAYHTCMRSAGEVWCMGDNDWGQLGRDITPYVELLAVAASPRIAAEQIVAGGEHTCVRRPGGDIACFGKDNYGQVGEEGLCPRNPTVELYVDTKDAPHEVLRKDGIHYTNANAIDIYVTTTSCAQVSGVDFRNQSIEPDDPIEPSDGLDYEIMSTRENDNGTREHLVRVHFPNLNNGWSYPARVTVRSPQGVTASGEVTLVEVREINANSGSLHVTEDEVKNEVLAAIYDKWGDANYYVRPGSSPNPYDFDYDYFSLDFNTDGVELLAKTKADLITAFNDSNLCNPTVYVYGKFRVALSGPDIVTQWSTGPFVVTDFPIGCQFVTAFLANYIGSILSTIIIDDNIAARIQKKLSKLQERCDVVGGCDALIDTIVHEDGAIRIKLKRVFELESVTFDVPYNTSAIDMPASMTRGVALPMNEGVIVVAGGVAHACGTQTGECTLHSFGASGLFNWNWTPVTPGIEDDQPHVPIPDPWPDCPNETCPYYDGRHGPWRNLEGLRRSLADVRLPAENPGAVIGKVVIDGAASLPGVLDQPCGISAGAGTASRLVVARNEVPSGGTYSGAFGYGNAEVTISFGDLADWLSPCVP